MITIVLVGLAVLGLGSLALWHPRLVVFIHRFPWWVGVGLPSVTLAIVALFATRIDELVSEDVGRAASVLAVLVAVTGGGPITVALLHGVERAVPGVSEPTAVLPIETAARTGGEVLKGGSWIGILERAAIASAILVGLPEGVAITVAIKGLARYPELRVVGASERFIIGTFASALWAAAAAGVANLVSHG